MNIGRDSPVGAYMRGRSPYGCEELSGNILEWTRSNLEDYPYPEDEAGRRAREDRRAQARRVLRGGSQRVARCSFRFDHYPVVRDHYLGFRVVLSPLL